MILTIYNGSPLLLLFFGIDKIVQLLKHIHGLQLIDKHENEKCGNYYTHTFLSKTLYFANNNKNGSL